MIQYMNPAPPSVRQSLVGPVPPKFGRLRLDDGPERGRPLPGMESRDWFLAYTSLVKIGFPSRVVSR